MKNFSISRKWLVLTLILALGMLLIAGCGKTKSTAGQDVKFKIGHCTWVGYGPLYIAKEKGFFKEHNIDPQMVLIEDESQYAAVLTSNKVQALGNVVDREVVHYADGVPIRFVCGMDQSYGGDGIIASSDIHSVKDLEGKTIGLDKASTSYFFFLSVLKKYGVDESKIKIEQMAAGDAGAAFVAGKLDAAVSWEPWLTKSSQRQGGHVLVSSRDFPGIITDVIAMRQDFIDQHPQAVQGLVEAWNEAVAYYQKHPAEGNKIIGKALSLSPKEVADMAKGVRFMGAKENAEFFNPALSGNTLYHITSMANQFWNEKGVINKNVDPNKIIEPKFVETAAKQN